MRTIATLTAAFGLLWPAAAQAEVPVEDIERIVALICAEDMSVASHADSTTRESCKAEFVRDGKRYEVAYWLERRERSIEVRRGRPAVQIVDVDEWLTFSIIDTAQFAHFDGRRIHEQWVSLENRSGEIRSGMSGYAFEGGFKPPFIDRYSPGDIFADIAPEGLHLKPHWQHIVDQAAKAALDHFDTLRQQAALR